MLTFAQAIYGTCERRLRRPRDFAASLIVKGFPLYEKYSTQFRHR